MDDDVYQHPVFFECHRLQTEQKRKIGIYFSNRRKSGGGECGSIRRIKENVYSVAFKLQQDQQRVLGRSKHELGDGSLVFSVRDSVDPQTPTTMTPSTSQECTDSAESPQSVPALTHSPSDEVYEMRRDDFLLRYLHECPEALNKLQEKLSTVFCSAHIYPEEERVLVRRLAQPDAADEGRKWKSVVDTIFDGYQCHYEVDPHKVKALLQSCSSQHTTDEVKVYSEGVTAVVVGECSRVLARLMDVEDSTVKRRVSCLREKKSSVHRLGEAKLCLLWKEIKHSLGRDFPAVTVTQGDAGQLVLEGYVEEVLKASAWVSEKENLVCDRTVCVHSPHVLSFLQKAYGGYIVLGDVLGLGDDVAIELQDTQLCFFTLSADKLDDIQNTLERMFREIKTDVPNCSTVPSELQEMLKSKTNELNQSQCKVQVVFSESAVHLLGHTKEVEELSEIVTQFILDQTSVQSSFHFPFPVLAHELPEFLQLHGFDFSGITFHPPTFSSDTVVVLEGQSCKVTDVQNRLGVFLDSLLQHEVITEPYLKSSSKDKFPVVDEFLSCNDTAALHLGPLTLSEGNIAVASYSLRDGLQVLVCQGDITKQEADVLVNAANENLDHCGGVAAALSKAGGPEVQKESKALVKQYGTIPTGHAVLTSAGNLKCKKLLHAVGPVGGNAGGRERFLLKTTVKSALNLAEMMEFRSIAMPCISSGLFGVPVPVCAEAIVTAVKEFGSQGGRSLRTIILIDNRGEVVRAMHEACDRILQGINTTNITPRDPKSFMGAEPPAQGATAAEDGVRVEIVQGTIETQQVDALVCPMVGHNPHSTRVGNTLSEKVGSQLTVRFTEEAEDSLPGDAVLVKGLSGLLSPAVFFFNLIPWDDDPEGTAVQVLRLSINNMLTSCEDQGFRCVALPALGAGIALRFPASVVARVLLEEVHAYKPSRADKTPLLVRIVIHPNDAESNEVFQCVQKDFTKNLFQLDRGSTTKRIVFLGKTGTGKSSLANTIFEEELFLSNHTPNSGTKICQSETRLVNERNITLIDTPGLFDAGRSEEELKPEIVSCITECSPGPHAFLIVLKVEKFTEQEQAVIDKICKYFSEDALKYAVIVFTHGEQLPKRRTIEEFVSQNKNLSDLVEKCGGRCHVFDNTYWKNKQQNNYRSNQFQVEKLLDTIDKMVMDNNGGYYTNTMLQVVEEEIKQEVKLIKQTTGNMSDDEIRKQAKIAVFHRFVIQLTGITTGALLGAFFGLAIMVPESLDVRGLNSAMGFIKLLKSYPKMLKAAAAEGTMEKINTGVLTATGGVAGAFIGLEAAKGAETLQEAAGRAYKAVTEQRQALQ